MSEWYQQALTPPVVVECNIRIGIIPSEDHVQVLAELKDPTNGVMLAQWSRPHATMRTLDEAIADAARHALVMCREAIGPFDF